MGGTVFPELRRTAAPHQRAQLRQRKDAISKSYAAQSNGRCDCDFGFCSAPWPCLTAGFDNFTRLRIVIPALPDFTAPLLVEYLEWRRGVGKNITEIREGKGKLNITYSGEKGVIAKQVGNSHL